MSKRRGVSEPVSLVEVLSKYWELANLDPEITKGSITGQLKALDSLVDALRVPAPGEERGAPRGAGIYRASWMVEAGREN